MIKEIYCKINNFFVINYRRKRKSVSDQKKFLKKFKDPINDYECAYDKYLCQMYYHYPFLLRLAYHIGAFCLIPFLYCSYSRNTRKTFKSEDYNYIDKKVIVRKAKKLSSEDVLPEEFINSKGSLIEVPFPSVKDGILDSDAKKIVKSVVKKYWGHPYFILLIIIKIGEYAYLIKKYEPKCILSYVFERDSINPLESMYCESKGIDHICFMHGDSMYSVDRAFSRPTYYCVWDTHYINMFHDLRCSAKEFVLYTPKKWMIHDVVRSDGNYPYFATYYFSAETPQIVAGVKKVFDQLKEKGLKCKVRVHPRFSDVQSISQIFDGYTIETSDVTLQESLFNTLYVIGLNSTVLSQAYIAGKDTIIDDMTDVNRYNSLFERDYIMVKYPLKRLSTLLNEVIKLNETGP